MKGSVRNPTGGMEVFYITVCTGFKKNLLIFTYLLICGKYTAILNINTF